MSASSLQFGPEWMRKAPAKSSTASAQSNATDSSSITSPAEGTAQDASEGGVSSASGAGSTRSSSGTRRNQSLGNLSTSQHLSPTSPAPVTSSVPGASAGAFSFAAAASGGAHAAAQGNQGVAVSEGATPGTAFQAGDSDSLRYSKRLLSLYSSERGPKSGKSSRSPRAASGPGALSDADPVAVVSTGNSEGGPGPGSGFQKRKGGPGSVERDSRRTADSHGSGGRPHSPTGEPRGLNARGTELRSEGQRPGLFQRGSSTGAAPTMTSPTALQPRERHGSGIQGGVLSSVVPPTRKRKDSETGIEPLRTPRSPQDVDNMWDRRGPVLNDAFSSARSRTTRTLQEESGTENGTDAPSSANGTWSRFPKRDRALVEGPVGPPSDGSTGFGKFAGYDRKRERQANLSGPRKTNDTALSSTPHGQRDHGDHHDGSGFQSTSGGEESKDDQIRGSRSAESELTHHATSILDSLKLDDDLSESGLEAAAYAEGVPQTEARLTPQTVRNWSPETAHWQYRDPQGQVQGPFTAAIMQQWYAGSYFTESLLVKRVEDGDFRTLGETLAYIGNHTTPFLIHPSDYAGRNATVAGISAIGGPPHSSQQELQGYQEPEGDLHTTLLRNQHREGDSFRSSNNDLGGSQAWPTQIDFGYMPASPASATLPQSPFTSNGGIFGVQHPPYGDLDPRFRQHPQDEYLALLRHRELQEQRAAMPHGHASSFATHLGVGSLPQRAGSDAWNQSAGVGPSWGSPSQHEVSPSFGVMSGDTNQQQQFDVLSEPELTTWEGTVEPTVESQRQHEAVSRDAQVVGILDGQFSQDKSEVQPQGDAGQAMDQKEDRSVSSRAAQGDSNESDMSNQVDDPYQQQEQLPSTRPQEHEQAKELVPIPKSSEVDNTAVEKLWPQSPSAVEFASEPFSSLTQRFEGELHTPESPSAKRRNRRQRGKQGEEAGTTAPDSAPVSAGGSVRVVPEDQFRRPHQEAPTGQQVPLTAWLPDSTSTSQGETAASTKAPWSHATENAAGAAPGLSLREIQEAESRQAEVRRAAVAERQRLNTPVRTSSNEGPLPPTMTWGLASVPTSANRTDSHSPAPNAPNQQTPVWNAGARQAPKKTLTEIQEEERKRAQRVKDVQTQNAIARSKGYADSASRSQTQGISGANSSSGGSGSWNVVGPSGKPTNPSVAASAPTPTPAPNAAPPSSKPPQAPAAHRLASTASAASPGWNVAGGTSKTNGGAIRSVSSTTVPPSLSSRPKAPNALAPPSAASFGPATTTANGDPVPSPEFLRHCKEQLKGLNVKVDDFIEMLLSFPLDPSPDVVDIIADSVYANSSTLDGRRFAADFVAKRKLDAAGRGPVTNAVNRISGSNDVLSRSSASNGFTSPGQKSASDVLKQQAPKTDAFGGFKVVKAKGNKKKG